MYTDTLLQMLKSNDVGCYLGLNFCGALSYADDLILIFPSATSMKEILSICESFAKEYQIAFNANKSQLLLFKGKYHIRGTVSFKVNGHLIEYASLVKHLRHQLATETSALVKCNIITAAFNKAVNFFLANFGHLNSLMLVNLFHQYFCSFYGITLLDLHAPNVTLFSMLLVEKQSDVC